MHPENGERLAQWHAILSALEEARGEDFAGEDATPPILRGHLEATEQAMARVAEAWDDAGQAFGIEELGSFEATEETRVQVMEDARHLLRALDGDDY